MDGSVINGYRIYRGTSSVLLAPIATVDNALAYTDTAVTNGVTYYYRVSALSGPDEGPRSNEAIATPREFIAPAVTIVSPANGTSVVGPSVMVSGMASDDTAVARVEVSTDGATWALANGTTSWSATLTLAAGETTVYARATDTSGNNETASLTVRVVEPLAVGPVLVLAASGGAIAAGLILFLRRRRRWEE